MDLAEDCKKISKEIIYEKRRKCRYCECISSGVFGCHYACMNEKSRNFRMNPPLCSVECDGYEQDYGYGVDD